MGSSTGWGGRWRAWCVVAALTCVAACGDDDGESIDAPAADAGGGASGGDDAATRDAASPTGFDGSCSLAGRWAVKRVAFALADTALSTMPQKSARWYYLEVEQDGDDVTLTRGVWCGDLTTGDADVRYSGESELAIRPLASTDGRQGSFRAVDGACELELERIYWLYGVDPVPDFLPGIEAPPGRIEGTPALSDLPELPTDGSDPAVVDSDGDGNPGVRSLLTDSPLGSGVRHGLQRGWEEMGGVVEGSADDFRVDVGYDFQEVALSAVPELFAVGASVLDGAPHAARFLRADDQLPASDDAETCTAVRDLLPHRRAPSDAW